ncbi:MAG: ATP-binding protein, partial [Mesorhizobium sp.]
RQIELLKMLRRMDQSGTAQVIMATHSPLLMACPGARLFRISRSGLDPTDLSDTDHFRMMRNFCNDPDGFLAEALYEDEA